MTPPEESNDPLLTPVQYLPGVGPRRATPLARLGLRTARDVLFLFPREYEDLTDVRRVADLEEGAPVTVCGTVVETDSQTSRAGRNIVGLLVRDGDAYLRAVWFDQPFMFRKFQRDQRVVLSGKAKRTGLEWEMTHPRVRALDGDEQTAVEGRLVPVYPLTDGLKQGLVRRIVRNVVETRAELVDEVFPDEYLAEHDLWDIRRALSAIHLPANREELNAARRRFVYQELLILQLGLAVRRQAVRDQARAPCLEKSSKIDARIRSRLPFSLTPGQEAVIDEIARDMRGPHPMNRLLQGDVGSGKTVVAVYAMLLAVAHGHQAVLMAPTEILARQHTETIGKLLEASRVRCATLTGTLTASQRQQTLKRVAAGETDVVIGTHAVVQEGVSFARLGLVVVDEQHKFGVRQRATLRQSGYDPHYLVMTATPIPRTIALALFGDLDVSTLRDHPPGRQQVYTYVTAAADRPRWWEFVRRKLREGRQAYVVVPLITASEEEQISGVEQTARRLRQAELRGFRLGTMHGRMAIDAKDEVMQAFRRGELDVLVSTTVIEVGIDVANATLMTIEDGQRFGLSQLHQLRGRVSRGTHPGFCCVFAEQTSDDSRRRLDAFAQTSDGFRLAEVDFALRGPGDLFGTRQHGLPPMRIADLRRDHELLEEARRDARQLVKEDPGLALDAHQRLRQMVLRRYGDVMDLGDVG